MKRSRTWLTWLLGLVLLAQGYAVAAAPRISLGSNLPHSSAVMADMPCHASMAMKHGQKGKARPSCCNESCPDMTTCALGHLASVAAAELTVPPAVQESVHVVPSRIEARAASSPLRPPISLHG